MAIVPRSWYYTWLLLVGFLGRVIHSLDNGLARTPPMGWLSWERFGCNTDCENDPDDCIGERLLMMMADVMAADGYLEAGYQYVTVDDCWLANNRDKDGRLQPDPTRFPRGMKHLADYIHSKGLKLGVYEDVGTHTCAGFPGTLDHYELDAQTIADWGVDMLKFDGCNTDVSHYNIGYPAMGHYLNKTGRPILYLCEWPVYMRALGAKPNYTAIAETCNTFRVYGDIMDSFQSIGSITSWYADNTGHFLEVVKPGSFTDADMLVIGDYGLSRDEERVQMGLWSIFASQLLMSVDLRIINNVSKALLLNKHVIAINQDPLGLPGRHVLSMYNDTFHIWTRPITPTGSYAIAATYSKQQGYPIHVTLPLSAINLTAPQGYNITEVFDNTAVGYLKPNQNLTYVVNPSGINLLRATVMQ